MTLERAGDGVLGFDNENEAQGEEQGDEGQEEAVHVKAARDPGQPTRE